MSINCIRVEADLNQLNLCKGKILDLDSSFENLSSILHLAGNKVRLQILYLLHQEDSLCVCDLSDILSMNVSAISQHLRKLKDRRIISPERKGQTIYYQINSEFDDLLHPLYAKVENKISVL